MKNKTDNMTIEELLDESERCLMMECEMTVKKAKLKTNDLAEQTLSEQNCEVI